MEYIKQNKKEMGRGTFLVPGCVLAVRKLGLKVGYQEKNILIKNGDTAPQAAHRSRAGILGGVQELWICGTEERGLVGRADVWSRQSQLSFRS